MRLTHHITLPLQPWLALVFAFQQFQCVFQLGFESLPLSTATAVIPLNQVFTYHSLLLLLLLLIDLHPNLLFLRPLTFSLKIFLNYSMKQDANHQVNQAIGATNDSFHPFLSFPSLPLSLPSLPLFHDQLIATRPPFDPPTDRVNNLISSASDSLPLVICTTTATATTTTSSFCNKSYSIDVTFVACISYSCRRVKSPCLWHNESAAGERRLLQDCVM